MVSTNHASSKWPQRCNLSWLFRINRSLEPKIRDSRKPFSIIHILQNQTLRRCKARQKSWGVPPFSTEKSLRGSMIIVLQVHDTSDSILVKKKSQSSYFRCTFLQLKGPDRIRTLHVFGKIIGAFHSLKNTSDNYCCMKSPQTGSACTLAWQFQFNNENIFRKAAANTRLSWPKIHVVYYIAWKCTYNSKWSLSMGTFQGQRSHS